jgi:hypothetical protein
MLPRQWHKTEIAQYFVTEAIGFAVYAHHLLVVAALADRYDEDAAGLELRNDGRANGWLCTGSNILQAFFQLEATDSFNNMAGKQLVYLLTER